MKTIRLVYIYFSTFFGISLQSWFDLVYMDILPENIISIGGENLDQPHCWIRCKQTKGCHAIGLPTDVFDDDKKGRCYLLKKGKDGRRADELISQDYAVLWEVIR